MLSAAGNAALLCSDLFTPCYESRASSSSTLTYRESFFFRQTYRESWLGLLRTSDSPNSPHTRAGQRLSPHTHSRSASLFSEERAPRDRGETRALSFPRWAVVVTVGQ